MSSITAITRSERNPNRMLVKIGERTVASLPLRVVESLGLSIDGDWDDAIAERAKEVTTFEKALATAMRKVGTRPTSRRRLEDKLKRAGWEEAMVARVVERLRATGALDDEAFGRSLVREFQARRPAGPALLRAKLRQRGLD